MLTLVQGATLLISDLPYNGIPDSYLSIVDHQLLGLPFVVVVFLAIALVVHVILSTTKLGRWLYAIGGSENAAQLAGIRVRYVKIAIYALNGFLVGWGAMLLVAQLASSQPYMGQGLELAAIAAVAVGGTPLAGGRGDILGTLMGVLLLGLIANSLILLGIPNNLQYVLQGLVIIVAVMAQRD
jgi:ribose/xylose/arabinose/galactoside ABC-type transport system permease subunit